TPPALVYQSRFHEVVDNVVVSEHLFGQHVFWIRDDALKAMPDELQAIVRESAHEATVRAWEELEAGEEEALSELEAHGLTVTRLTEEERAAFRKATVPVVRDFEKRLDDRLGDGRAFMTRIYNAVGQDYEALIAE